MKINAAVISQNPEIRDPLVEALESLPRLNAIWILSEYPRREKLAELVEAEHCILFLDYSDPAAAMVVAKEVDERLKSVATVALLGAEGDPGLLVGLLRVGGREVLQSAWTSPELCYVADHSETRSNQQPHCQQE